MKNSRPKPVCKCFLLCREIVGDAGSGDESMIGLPQQFCSDQYPAQMPINVFCRFDAGRGRYSVEVQLQNSDGEVVWKHRHEPWVMRDPLGTDDLKMKVDVHFPSAGIYHFALILDGEEISRFPFRAHLGEAPPGPTRSWSWSSPHAHRG